ncbi:hypothetical protein [Luteimonas granuli]|uniref:DUF4145 domain-containing protein n=1 Tax=Luteimonas granuli TaxID=1176533 RepID=A0A518N6Y9_9GAMM|nr:hypothetical protein [Luteimonas granuli]QDW67678.1 hypothetical protein FPZ22_12985 [Luteimonas granuli]
MNMWVARATFERTDNSSPLSDLVDRLESDKSIFVSKLGMRALKDFKRLGDLSAHNRRYNARVTDIDPLRAGIRLVAEELIHLAGLDAKKATAA